MELIKIVYIEDDPYIREFIAEQLKKDPEFDFLLASESVESFLEQAKLIRKPDVILQDISLPGMSGLEAIRHLKDLFPAAEIIMFTIYDDSEKIFKALCAGAGGYLLKSTPVPKIRESIVQVYRGEGAMSPSIARKVMEYFRPEQQRSTVLTARELQIVQCMVEGLSYKLIADKLMISVNTTGYHVKNIYRKLQVNSKAEVIAKSLKGEV
ncbi:response regulator [Flavilitoribacter nigricans]|uniref:DNA-binding response regulator n=1 Tax=Flavilitoribacter nigricans (strain ATCC 23147 / DSM 23189 / NBRC 102662 / NCIMB 1420 / SS-2) TaxID=1122177 RepID=A0A2D0N1B4_FLAN2|nr:response regulator transcription factor [Flavilitoribacter nigricans]PHN02156.1 DNA-binding response regulator [Flavilitoribacter nigricans DSM 23189 = NBRC 102662]